MSMPFIKRLRKQPAIQLRDVITVGLGAVLTIIFMIVFTAIRHSQPPVAYESAGLTTKWLPDTVTHWQDTIDKQAKIYNIDPNLVAIIMTMESGGDAKAKSQDNAIGLMQITPPTATDIAARYLKQPVKTYNLQDPATNIAFGTAYLAYLRNYFGNQQQGPDWTRTVELIAAGYNGGPGAAGRLDAGRGLTDTQTVVYSRDAFNMWRERFAGDSPTFDRWKERGGSDLLTAAAASQR